MLTHFERLVSFRYLRARRSEGFISVIALFSLIGIALGVATLIVVLSVMNGVRAEMIKSIVGLDGHVTVFSQQRGIQDYEQLAQNIRAIPGIKSAIPLVQGQVLVSANGQAAGAMVTGLRTEDLNVKPLLTSKIEQGDIEAFKRGEGVIIGSRMAERMGLRAGDFVTLISPEGQATPAGTVPRIKAYPVAAIFSIGMFAYDNGLIVMPFEQAQVYFKLKALGTGDWGLGNENPSTPNPQPPIPNKATALEILADDADASAALAQKITDAIGPGYRVYDWKATNGQILHAVEVQRNVMFLVLMLIIVVASFNVISSLIMLVREKGRAIAILRTMGATRGAVMRIFITCGASVGVMGTFFGVALGLLIAFNTESIQAWIESLTGKKLLADELYFLSHLPARVDMGEVAAVGLLALALSFLSTIYPARRAAALDPAEGLRDE